MYRGGGGEGVGGSPIFFIASLIDHHTEILFLKVEPLKTTQKLFSAQRGGKDSRKDEDKVGIGEGGSHSSWA